MSLLSLALQSPIPSEEQLHRGWITALSFSPSGHLLASTSEDGKVLVFSTHSGDLVDCIEMRQRAFLCIEWLTDTKFVVGISTGTVLVFDTLKKELQCNAFRVHRRGVECLAHQDKAIASGAGPEVYISAVQSSNEWLVMNTLMHPEFSASKSSMSDYPIVVTSIHWGARSTRTHAATLLVSYVYHGVSIWDLKTYTLIRTLPGTADIVMSVYQSLVDRVTHLAIAYRGSVSLSLEKNLLVLSNATESTLEIYNLKYMSKTRSLDSPVSMTPFSGLHFPYWRVPVQFAFGGNVIVGGRDQYGNPGVWKLSSETPKQVLNHDFNQNSKEESRGISAIACHHDISSKHAWIATATNLCVTDNGTLPPSVYIWRALERSSSRPVQKRADDPNLKQRDKRRRSFRLYSCYVLIFFTLYVLMLAHSTVVGSSDLSLNTAQ